jgi:hypothetical protein
MSDDNVPNSASLLPTFLAQDIVASQASLQSAVLQLAQVQVAGMRATFEALPLDQRDKFCQSLRDSGFTPNQIVGLTDKSYPTVNRHLNGKNSS